MSLADRLAIVRAELESERGRLRYIPPDLPFARDIIERLEAERDAIRAELADWDGVPHA